MKAVKLILTFLLIFVGIVVVLYLSNNDVDLEPLPPISPASLEEYREMFENDWKASGDWNDTLFESHCDLIHQLSRDYDVVSLNNLNTSTAVDVVCGRIFEEWETPLCKKNKIDYYIDAITKIEMSETNASLNPSVKKIKEVNEVYLQAYKLAHKSFDLTPTFDGSSWNSFSSYASGIESQKSSILNNTNYKEYLSNITEISKGLNDIPSRLSEGRSRFYSTLAINITDYYNEKISSERTMADLNSLRNAISRYESEYGSNSSLSSFARSYSDDVDKNEKLNEPI